MAPLEVAAAAAPIASRRRLSKRYRKCTERSSQSADAEDLGDAIAALNQRMLRNRLRQHAEGFSTSIQRRFRAFLIRSDACARISNRTPPRNQSFPQCYRAS